MGIYEIINWKETQDGLRVKDQDFAPSGTANLSNGPAPQVRWTTKLQAAHPGYATEPHTSTKDECRWVDDVKDGDCERRKVTQWSPISYAQFKYPKWIIKPDSIKVRLPKGDQFTCDLMNNASNTETYLKWIQVYIRMLGKKNLRVPLDVTTVDRKKLHKDMKKFLKVPKKESAENKVTR